MTTQNFYLKVTLLLVVTAMMTACGASKGSADNGDSSSRLAAADVAAADTSTRPLAYCNQTSNSAIGYNTSTYQDGETISVTKINMKLTKFPTDFNQSNTYFEVHKYMVSSAGQKTWGTTRLKMNIYSIADGKSLATSKSYLQWSDLTTAAAKLNVSTPEQFFKKARIVVELEDTLGEYDAVALIYRAQSDNSIVSQSDSLIPVFDANPTRYATETIGTSTTTRAASLQALHPFKSAQGWTPQVFQTKANEFCTPIYTVE